MARFLPFSAACSPLCQNPSRKKARKMPSMPSGRQRHRGLPLEALPRKSFAAMCQAAAISFTAFRTGRGKPPCQPILSESGCPSGKESGHCFVGIPFFLNQETFCASMLRHANGLARFRIRRDSIGDRLVVKAGAKRKARMFCAGNPCRGQSAPLVHQKIKNLPSNRENRSCEKRFHSGNAVWLVKMTKLGCRETSGNQARGYTNYC